MNDLESMNFSYTMIISVIFTSLIFLSTALILSIVFLRKRFRRKSIWDLPTQPQSDTNSAPISRRSSSSCLINLDKSLAAPRFRSASFGEDLTARLQILAAGSTYSSFSPTTIQNSSHVKRASLNNPMFRAIPSLPESSNKLTKPTMSFQLRYESNLEILSISIFQLNNCILSKTTETSFIIVYLLPNDEEQRQTQTSKDGNFNESFDIQIKSNDLARRTVRFTVYNVDSTTRIRTTVGHVFVSLNDWIEKDQQDRTFSTPVLSVELTKDLPTTSDDLGELVVTSYYLKDQNLLQIHLEEIHRFQWKSVTIPRPTKGYFSGRTSESYQNHLWINTPSLQIPATSSSFRIDQRLDFLIQPKSSIFGSDDQVLCHLRFHLQGIKSSLHSHARWEHSLRSHGPQTFKVPLHIS